MCEVSSSHLETTNVEPKEVFSRASPAQFKDCSASSWPPGAFQVPLCHSVFLSVKWDNYGMNSSLEGEVNVVPTFVGEETEAQKEEIGRAHV